MLQSQKASQTGPTRSLGARWQQSGLLLSLVILGVIGVVLTLYASRWGPWAFSDGVGYLVTARNFVLGKGFGLYRPSGAFIPTVTHPPLFPFLVAVLIKTSGDVLVASRILGALIFSAFILIIPLLFRRLLGLGALAMMLGIWLITHPAVILMFLAAMSEPLFVLVGTAGLLCTCLYLLDRRPIFLAASCGLVALAMLTRYAGLAYVTTGALALLILHRRGTWQFRLSRSAVYSAAGLAPALIFLAYWNQTPFARTVRGFALPTSIGESLSLFINRVGSSLWSWKPVPIPAVLATVLQSPDKRIALVLILVFLLLAAIVIARLLHLELAVDAASQDRHALAGTALLLKTFSLFVIVFLGTMLVAFTFSSPTPDIDPRTLFPLLPSMMIILLGVIKSALATRPQSRSLHWLAVGLLIMFAIGSAPAGLDIVTGLNRTGLGFTAKAWHESETMEFVDGLNPQAILVSNSPEAIMLYTGRSAYQLPFAEDQSPLSQVSSSRTILSSIDRIICDEGGTLVFFDGALDGIAARVSPEMTLNGLSCDLVAVFQSADGRIYRFEDTLK